MNCLKPEEIMSLVYLEDRPENIVKYKNHIKTCSKCFDEFMEFNEVRNTLKEDGKVISPQVIVIKSKPKEFGYGSFAVAAVFLMTLALSYFVSNSLKQIKKEQVIMAKKQETINTELQKTSYLMEDYSKQNYMLMMGLKDYIDNNMGTMKVKYEKF